MAELKSLSPCAGLLPRSHGGVTVTELNWDPIWSIAPFKGQADAVSSALQAALGCGFPAPGDSVKNGASQVIWSGLDQAFLVGATPPDGLQAIAAITDQSDAWAVVELSGPGSEAVLARLIPVDVRLAAFPVGRSARTQVQHMTCLLLRTAEDRFAIAAFRSMAGTLVHDLDTAMQALEARKGA